MTSRLLKQDSNIQQYQHTHPHYSRSYFSSHCSFSINCKDTIIMDGSRERRRTREMTKKLLHKFNVLFSLTHSLTQSFSSPDFLSLSSMLLILSTGKNIFKKEIGWMEQLGFRFNVNFFLPFSFLSLSLSLTTRLFILPGSQVMPKSLSQTFRIPFTEWTLNSQ